MKKMVLSMALAVAMVVCLVGCGTTYQEATGQTENNASDDFGNGYFTVIAEWSDANYDYKIICANDTKVKYFVMCSYYKLDITPLYNADGTLQIYEESED